MNFLSYVWVVLHEDQELWPSVGRCPLICGQEAGDVVMLLQQRQAVDGALVGVVLPVGRAEEFDGHAALIETSAKHGAITTSTNQLPGDQRVALERRTHVVFRASFEQVKNMTKLSSTYAFIKCSCCMLFIC